MSRADFSVNDRPFLWSHSGGRPSLGCLPTAQPRPAVQASGIAPIKGSIPTKILWFRLRLIRVG